jgi:hypothetical protein
LRWVLIRGGKTLPFLLAGFKLSIWSRSTEKRPEIIFDALSDSYDGVIPINRPLKIVNQSDNPSKMIGILEEN